MPLLRMSLLRAEPAGTLQSLDELFALANAMEQEAATKYTELADEMQRQDRPDLVTVFRDLAAAEREHVDSVQRWSQSWRGKPPDPALVRWEAPETFDKDAAAEIRTSRLMTPYRALAIAVQNEQRAFAFWSYMAAFSGDAEIKKVAEAMAREELGHVSTLRKERRRSYHKEHVGAAEAGDLNQAQSQAQVDAARLELRIAAQLADLEPTLDPASAARTRELHDEAIAMSAETQGLGRFPLALEQADIQTIAEAVVDAYLDGAERADDPDRMDTLQRLGAQAISRLAWLRSLIAG